jgi:FeS assembly SUF system regulator
MFKLGKLTDYAVVLLAEMARQPDALFTGHELAARTQVSAPTAAKLLKALQRGGLVTSLRGAKGGYRLAAAPQTISVATVISALEGPIAVTDCATHGSCALEYGCGAKAPFRLINAAITQALEAVTLADMAASLAPGKRLRASATEFPLQFHPARSQVPHDQPS